MGRESRCQIINLAEASKAQQAGSKQHLLPFAPGGRKTLPRNFAFARVRNSLTLRDHLLRLGLGPIDFNSAMIALGDPRSFDSLKRWTQRNLDIVPSGSVMAVIVLLEQHFAPSGPASDESQRSLSQELPLVKNNSPGEAKSNLIPIGKIPAICRSVEQALGAARQANLPNVVILSETEDGFVLISASDDGPLTSAQVMWLLEASKMAIFAKYEQDDG